MLIVGGSTGQSFIGTSSPASAPAGQVALNTAELYNPATDAFTATGSIPGCAAGVAACAGPACGMRGRFERDLVHRRRAERR